MQKILRWLRNFLIFVFFFVLYLFIQQIRNVCGTKSQNSTTDKIDEQKQCVSKANHSDIYLAQLKNFIANNSHESFKCKHYQTKSLQIAQSHHNNKNRSTILTNDLVLVNQSKDLGRKCKRFVYKFMKGLFDERTFKNGKILKEEPIYFEVCLIDYDLWSIETTIII